MIDQAMIEKSIVIIFINFIAISLSYTFEI